MPEARVSHFVAEVSGTNPGSIRVSQIVVEVTTTVQYAVSGTGLQPVSSRSIYSIGAQVGAAPAYNLLALELPLDFVVYASADSIAFSGSSSMAAFLTNEWDAAVSMDGAASATFSPGGSIFLGAANLAGVGNFSSLGSMIWNSPRVISGGNGDVYWLGSKFFFESVLLTAFGDSYFFGGFQVNGQTSNMQGVGNALFRALGRELSGEVSFRGDGDAVFQALVQLGGFQVAEEFYKIFVVDDADLRYLTMQEIRLVLPQYSRYRDSEVILAKDTVMLSVYRALNLLKDDSDQVYETTLQDQGRLDRIAFRMYGVSALWWVLALVNGIRDPFTVPNGTILRIPTHDRIMREMTSRDSRRS